MGIDSGRDENHDAEIKIRNQPGAAFFSGKPRFVPERIWRSLSPENINLTCQEIATLSEIQ